MSVKNLKFAASLLSFNPVRLALVPLATAGLVAGALMPAPAKANPYDTCARRLAGLNLPADAIADACAKALYPQDLARCVTRLSGNNVPAADALSTCTRVRRPVDLSTCVIDIRADVKDAALPEVLDSCRRSLLPTRYGQCVVGLSSKLKLNATTALNTCIDASDRPRDFAPTFIPAGTPVPTTPGLDTPVVPETITPPQTPNSIPNNTPSPSPANPTQPVPQRG